MLLALVTNDKLFIFSTVTATSTAVNDSNNVTSHDPCLVYTTVILVLATDTFATTHGASKQTVNDIPSQVGVGVAFSRRQERHASSL